MWAVDKKKTLAILSLRGCTGASGFDASVASLFLPVNSLNQNLIKLSQNKR